MQRRRHVADALAQPLGQELLVPGREHHRMPPGFDHRLPADEDGVGRAAHLQRQRAVAAAADGPDPRLVGLRPRRTRRLRPTCPSPRSCRPPPSTAARPSAGPAFHSLFSWACTRARLEADERRPDHEEALDADALAQVAESRHAVALQVRAGHAVDRAVRLPLEAPPDIARRCRRRRTRPSKVSTVFIGMPLQDAEGLVVDLVGPLQVLACCSSGTVDDHQLLVRQQPDLPVPRVERARHQHRQLGVDVAGDLRVAEEALAAHQFGHEAQAALADDGDVAACTANAKRLPTGTRPMYQRPSTRKVEASSGSSPPYTSTSPWSRDDHQLVRQARAAACRRRRHRSS